MDHPKKNVMTDNISISELKEKTIDELTEVARELNVEGASSLRKQGRRCRSCRAVACLAVMLARSALICNSSKIAVNTPVDIMVVF